MGGERSDSGETWTLRPEVSDPGPFSCWHTLLHGKGQPGAGGSSYKLPSSRRLPGRLEASHSTSEILLLLDVLHGSTLAAMGAVFWVTAWVKWYCSKCTFITLAPGSRGTATSLSGVPYKRQV